MNAWTARSSATVARSHALTSVGVHFRRATFAAGARLRELKGDVSLLDAPSVEPEVEGSVVTRGERKDKNALYAEALGVGRDGRPQSAVERLRGLLGDVEPVADVAHAAVLVEPPGNVDRLAHVEYGSVQIAQKVDTNMDLAVEELSFGAKRLRLGKGCQFWPGCKGVHLLYNTLSPIPRVTTLFGQNSGETHSFYATPS